MTYTIKNEGKIANAEFHLWSWTESGWVDIIEELESNALDGSELTLAEYQQIIDYWTMEVESGEDGDWDFGRGEYSVEYTAIDELEWETTQADADEEGTEVRWDVYTYQVELRAKAVRRVSADDLVDGVVGKYGGLEAGSYDSFDDAIAVCGGRVYNKAGRCGILRTIVEVAWAEESLYDGEGEFCGLANFDRHRGEVTDLRAEVSE